MKIRLKIALSLMLPFLLLISTQKTSANKLVQVIFHTPLDFNADDNSDHLQPSREMEFPDHAKIPKVISEIGNVENAEGSNPQDDSSYSKITDHYHLFLVNDKHTELILIRDINQSLADLSSCHQMFFLAIQKEVLSKLALEDRRYVMNEVIQTANDATGPIQSEEEDSPTPRLFAPGVDLSFLPDFKPNLARMSPRNLALRILTPAKRIIYTPPFNPYQETIQNLLGAMNIQNDGEYVLFGRDGVILNNSATFSYYNVQPDDVLVLAKTHPEINQETWKLINDDQAFKDEVDRLMKAVSSRTDATTRLKDQRLAKLEQHRRSARKYDQNKLKLFEQQEQNQSSEQFSTTIPTTSQLSNAPLPTIF